MTELRAFRMALGMSMAEVGELIEYSEQSVSMAERDIGCPGCRDAESDFLNRVYLALCPSERHAVCEIQRALRRREEFKDTFRSKAQGSIMETVNAE